MKLTFKMSTISAAKKWLKEKKQALMMELPLTKQACETVPPKGRSLERERREGLAQCRVQQRRVFLQHFGVTPDRTNHIQQVVIEVR